MICQFCSNKNLIRYCDKFSEITKKKIHYFICDKCYSIHQNPLPDSKTIQKYYDNYLKIKSKMNPGYLDEKNLSFFFNERDKTLKEIGFDKKRFIGSSNVEVGCATGDFLRYISDNGAKDITGIDLSNDLLRKIKIKNITKIKGDLLRLKEKSIDNLYLFNILEHFDDVEKVLKSAKSRLKENAMMIIEVPLTGFISSLFSARWRFLMADEHLHIPSLKGLKIFLKRHGFKIIGKTRFGSGFTKGSINDKIKLLIDKCVKFAGIGDRGTFLVINKK